MGEYIALAIPSWIWRLIHRHSGMRARISVDRAAFAREIRSIERSARAHVCRSISYKIIQNNGMQVRARTSLDRPKCARECRSIDRNARACRSTDLLCGVMVRSRSFGSAFVVSLVSPIPMMIASICGPKSLARSLPLRCGSVVGALSRWRGHPLAWSDRECTKSLARSPPCQVCDATYRSLLQSTTIQLRKPSA